MTIYYVGEDVLIDPANLKKVQDIVDRLETDLILEGEEMPGVAVERELLEIGETKIIDVLKKNGLL